MNDMTDATHVDGNALGGLLIEVFGREMTDADGCCATCGRVHPLGAMRVYRTAGDVMRCPSCGNVTIVAVAIRDHTRIHLGGVRWIEPVP
jgi:predicted RNA-binding Zn-ribbon protein involved in translation (DUF1610 family)